MDRKWSRILPSLVVLSVALTSSKLALASANYPAALEIDPSLVIPGLALAGAGAAVILERMRRRREVETCPTPKDQSRCGKRK